jgi:hypothetical protein
LPTVRDEQTLLLRVGDPGKPFLLSVRLNERGHFVIVPRTRQEAQCAIGVLNRMLVELSFMAYDLPAEKLATGKPNAREKFRKTATKALEGLSVCANRVHEKFIRRSRK